MELDSEVHHRPAQEHMATNAISKLPTSQLDEPGIDNYNLAYEDHDDHAVTDLILENMVGPLTMQSLLSA